MATVIWQEISSLFGKTTIGTDFESVARWWISNKNNTVLNCVCAATLWSLGNCVMVCVFREGRGVVEQVFSRIAQTLKSWSVLSKEGAKEGIDSKAGALEKRGARPPRVSWTVAPTTSSSAVSSAAQSLLDFNAVEAAPMFLPTHTSDVGTPFSQAQGLDGVETFVLGRGRA